MYLMLLKDAKKQVEKLKTDLSELDERRLFLFKARKWFKDKDSDNQLLDKYLVYLKHQREAHNIVDTFNKKNKEEVIDKMRAKLVQERGLLFEMSNIM